VFLGTHHPRLDDKGRLTLPAKFREGLAGGIVLTKGQDRSLVVWPTAEFADYAARIREASRSDAKARAYSRVFFSTAFDQVPDRQGRVTIPPALRDYAGLGDDRDCVVVGNHDTVEIWNASAWDEYLTASEPEFADLSEEVVPGLF
jgi:MraZ protein